MNQATPSSSLLAATLSLPGGAALAYDTVWGMPADWHNPMLAGNVYRSDLMVRDQLKRARQAVEAKHRSQAAKRLYFTLNYLPTVREAVPYQAMMRDIKLARLAIHDHDPLLTAAYFRTLRADIDHIALAMPDQPETPAKALDLLDRTEKAVHFTGKETNDCRMDASDGF